MGHLRWDESPHWKKPAKLSPKRRSPALVLKSRHEIIDAIRDDPRYNTINLSDQAHIIDVAIAEAQKSGTLLEEQGELVNG